MCILRRDLGTPAIQDISFLSDHNLRIKPLAIDRSPGLALILLRSPPAAVSFASPPSRIPIAPFWQSRRLENLWWRVLIMLQRAIPAL
jgi:hypothetical protein